MPFVGLYSAAELDCRCYYSDVPLHFCGRQLSSGDDTEVSVAVSERTGFDCMIDYYCNYDYHYDGSCQCDGHYDCRHSPICVGSRVLNDWCSVVARLASASGIARSVRSVACVQN